jgi:C4-dicarboxylate-specific signal transduction histidine kinase
VEIDNKWDAKPGRGILPTAAEAGGSRTQQNRKRASAARFKKMYDRSSALAKLGVWECDLRTEQLTWTVGVYDLFELQRGIAVERANIVDLYYPESRREMEKLRARAIKGTGGFSLDVRVSTAAGRERWIRLTADVEQVNGRSVRLFGTKQDITEERLAQEKARRLQAELIHLSRQSAMETMATTLAHELNQPLTAICCYASGTHRALRQSIVDADALAANLRSIERNALRASAVIRAMRVITGDCSFQQPRPIDPNPAIREAVVVAVAGNETVNIRFDLAESALVLIEPSQLQQVIINLVQNAVEAGPASSRQAISVTSRVASGMLEIRVEDCGPGIRAEMLNWVFGASDSSTRNAVGLGLSICRTIVEAHGGKLLADNRGAQGASFGILIPLVGGP